MNHLTPPSCYGSFSFRSRSDSADAVALTHSIVRATPAYQSFQKSENPVGVRNTLRVRVCAAHMGGFLGPRFSKQGSLLRQIFHKQGWVIQKLAKTSKKWAVFRQNSSKKWVWQQLSVISRVCFSENRVADPRPSASHVPPPRAENHRCRRWTRPPSPLDS